MNRVLCLIAASSLLIALAASAEEATSRDNEVLKKGLLQYPDADVNHDGVLTETEGRAYEKRLREQRGGQPTQADPARPPAIAPDLANVACGPERRNAFDLWRPKTDKPVPVFIYFHGGGFMGGDKSRTPSA
jgi:hypothetical protein